MDDATSVLFDLPGFQIVSCEKTPGGRRIEVMQAAQEHACPRCGILVGEKPYDVRESRIKDLPMGHRPLQVVWRKRRYHCPERRCAQRLFTERSAQVPPRHRLTQRLQDKLERSASGSARSLADVAAEYAVSWWSVNRAVVRQAVERAAAPLPPVRMLGLDETRTRSPRWIWQTEGTNPGWRLSNPWMTSFIDLNTGRPGWLLGLVPGRSGAAVESWLVKQPQAWRDRIEVVALDPSAPFAAAVHRLLPAATIVVDHFHLVRLANQVVTEVRQRAARSPRPQGRSGVGTSPAAAGRRGQAEQAEAGPAQVRPCRR